MRGGDAGSLARGGTGLAAGASRATRGSAAAAGGVAAAAAHVRTAQLQDSALCWPDWGEEVVGGSTVGCAAYKCSTASAGTTHPVPVELFGEEEEVRRMALLRGRAWLGCRRWTSRSSCGTSGLVPLVEDSVCRRRLSFN